jgi:membrane-anchored glycerophosphoryl diester phosphodiesterase (GDPDase)
MNNRLPISGPLGLGDLLDRSFRLYRARFIPFLLTAAIFLAPLGIMSGLLSGNFITGYVDALSMLTSSPNLPADDRFYTLFGGMAGFATFVILIAILGLIANAVVTLSLTNQGIATLHEEPLAMGESIRRGLRRLGSYIWLLIVQGVVIGLATLAVLIPIFILIFALTFAGAAMSAALFSETDNIFVAIGLMVLIACGSFLMMLVVVAPATYLGARWIVAIPALVNEDLSATDALRRSWRLTGSRAWRAIGYLILLGLISTIVVSLPASFIQQILFIAAPSSAMPLFLSLSTAISSIFTVIWTPFYVCAIVLLYYDLRVRAEGYDLDLRVRQLEEQMANQQEPGGLQPEELG